METCDQLDDNPNNPNNPNNFSYEKVRVSYDVVRAVVAKCKSLFAHRSATRGRDSFRLTATKRLDTILWIPTRCNSLQTGRKLHIIRKGI